MTAKRSRNLLIVSSILPIVSTAAFYLYVQFGNNLPCWLECNIPRGVVYLGYLVVLLFPIPVWFGFALHAWKKKTFPRKYTAAVTVAYIAILISIYVIWSQDDVVWRWLAN